METNGLARTPSPPAGQPRVDTGALAPFPDYVDRGPIRLFSGLASIACAGDQRSADSWVDLADAPFDRQASAIYDVMERALEDSGGLSAVLRQHMYQRDKRRFPILESIRKQREQETGAAPSSGLGLSSLRAEWVNYELDAIALSPQGRRTLGPRTVLDAPGVGAAAALYSQAVAAGPYVFTAGMLALSDDLSGAVKSFDEIPAEGRWLQRGRSHPDYRMGPVVAQTWTLYQRLHAFLQAHGLELSDVCEATLFIHDEGDLADALRVHARWFGKEGPAVQIIPVDEVGHKGTVIEIEITASRSPLRRTPSLTAGDVPAVVEAGDLIFVSDHLPLVDETRILWTDEVEQFAASEQGLAEVLERMPLRDRLLGAQVWAALRSLANSLERSGVNPERLGQLTICIVDGSQDDFGWLDRMIRSVLGGVDRAIVVLRIPAVPHSRYARVVISGVGGNHVSHNSQAQHDGSDQGADDND